MLRLEGVFSMLLAQAHTRLAAPLVVVSVLISGHEGTYAHGHRRYRQALAIDKSIMCAIRNVSCTELRIVCVCACVSSARSPWA